MDSPATIASGVLTLVCLGATVKVHMDCRKMMKAGEKMM